MIDNNKKKSFKVGLAIYLNLGLAIIFTSASLYLINEIKTQEREQALDEAKIKAQLILDRNLAIHTYFSHTLKPKVFELTDPIRTPNYFEPAWMSSTFAVRQIDKIFKSINNEKYYYKECAINARSPENEADEFEKEFIEELNTNPKLEYRSLIRNLNNEYFFVTLRRGEVLEESCLRCHSTPDKAPKGLVDTYGPERSFNRSANEVVSAISIQVPLSAAYAKADLFSKHLSKIFVIVLLIIFTVQYFIHRFLILKPITKLKNKALSISKNEALLGEEISLPASREFEELTTAFNTMSLNLRFHMDNLEVMVDKRTSELKSLNEKLQKTLDEIKTLHGVLPICMHCKGIRDDKGSWTQLEKYISKHSEAQFSHGICEKCLRKYYPDVAD
jgi:HAMP domain-containing protein